MRWRKDKRRKNEEVQSENREMKGRIISQGEWIELEINEVRKERDNEW